VRSRPGSIVFLWVQGPAVEISVAPWRLPQPVFAKMILRHRMSRIFFVVALVCAAEEAAKTPTHHEAAGRTDDAPTPASFLLQVDLSHKSSAMASGGTDASSAHTIQIKTQQSLKAEAAALAKAEAQLTAFEQALTLDFEGYAAAVRAMGQVNHTNHKISYEVEKVLKKLEESEEEGGGKKKGGKKKGTAVIKDAMARNRANGGRRPRKTDKVQALLQAKLLAKAAEWEPVGFVQVGFEAFEPSSTPRFCPIEQEGL